MLVSIGGDGMEMALQILMVLEMIVMNMSTVHFCLRRRKSIVRILLIITAYTALVVGGGFLLLSRLPSFGNGNGGFVVVGLLYLFPLKYLYDEPLERLLEVVCTSWIYTMLVFALSVQIAYLFPSDGFTLYALLIQTGLYLLSAVPFLLFIRYLRLSSLMWFGTIIFINLSFVETANPLFKPLTLLLLMVNALLTYGLLYQTVKGSRRIARLQDSVCMDGLTALKNRSSLFVDAEALIREGSSFALIFLDLDEFKRVNDSYGHLAGDRYLSAFSASARELLKENGRLYRVGGDEFVCLYTAGEENVFLRQLDTMEWRGEGYPCAFLGVSYGCARYPEEENNLEALIRLADDNMYRSKKRRRERDSQSNTQ